MKRLRSGILLIIVSWLPIPFVVLQIAHNNNKLMSDAASQTFRLVIWGMQIVLGIIGLWLAGKPAIEQVKIAGVKKAPKRLWRLFCNKPMEAIHGEN
jgi:hypothetical protein